MMTKTHDDLTPPVDELIRLVINYIESNKYRESAVAYAGNAASALIAHGGEHARESIGVPPPDSAEQAKIRARGFHWSDDTADKLNAVLLEVNDDAALGFCGTGYWISADLFVPVVIDDEKTDA